MNFEANLVELHRIFRELTKENEALRALLADYEQLIEDAPPRVPSYDAVRWDIRCEELKGRYDALVKGEQQP